MTSKEIIELLTRFSNQPISAEEEELLLQNWLETADTKSIENVMEAYETIVMDAITSVKPDSILFDKIRAKVAQKELEQNEYQHSKLRILENVLVKPKILWRSIAAALFFFISGMAIYYMVSNNKAPIEMTSIDLVNEVSAPDLTKTVITLANGQHIALDSAGDGTLAIQGNITLEKDQDGNILYKVNKGEFKSDEISYNIISNPKGSKVVNLTLADGSKVWLNAGSSLKFPAAFTGRERAVLINGEAYFEVAPNKLKPFRVIKGNMEVIVIGTHFNVNAYDNDEEIKVTLLEGIVKVSNFSATSLGKTDQLLRPGQQATAKVDGTINLVNHADVEQIMAWKNYLFNFNKTPISDIMRQIERWYNVSVEYEGGKIPNITLSGIINRNLSANKILEMLELSGIRFKIEGKKIIVINDVK